MADADGPAVEVLLATYRGAEHLPAQLDSLLAQSFGGWRILARDDGSPDATREVLDAFAARHPGRLERIEDGETRLGPSRNFGRLLARSTAGRVACCDQDDIWLPGKLAVLLDRLHALEAEHGAGTPLLVHSDLRVVDAGLQPLAPSFWRYQNLDPVAASRFPRALLQNAVTGCALLVNRALLDLALPVPDEAIMHDWWLALVAAAFGRIEPVAEPLVLYRQHGSNQIGARGWGLRWILRRAAAYSGEMRESLRRVEAQAGAFLARFGDRISPADRAACAACAAWSRTGWFARRLGLARHGLWKCGAARNCGLLLRV